MAGWAPWRLLERGTEWILAPKSELVELLSGIRRLPVKEAMILSEEHKAVLLVVIGYNQKGGVSKRRVGEILGLDASSYLDDLLRQGLRQCCKFVVEPKICVDDRQFSSTPRTDRE
jgi:hypothetical protein